MIEISLDLSKHCIHTETRRVYDQLVTACFASHAIDKSTEAQLELLKQALETLDFQKLRSEYPELAGGSEHEVILAADDLGQIMIKIDKRVINLQSAATSN